MTEYFNYMRHILSILFGLFIGGLASASPTLDFTGHYELADTQADHVFALDVTQTGSTATLSFSAAMNDGAGAAPDGDGTGQLDQNGNLTFTFKDSFDNEGSGTLEKLADGYHLSLVPTKVVEPRPLRFYGTLLLKKISDKPSSPSS